MHIALYQPEIPPNTGNVIRLCANTGARLHLIEPLGFELDDRRLRRAGLDYHEWANIVVHESLTGCLKVARPRTIYAITTRATRHYCDADFHGDDLLLFGPETRGLPDAVLRALPEAQRLRIPMLPHSRSLNLSNSVAVVLYEAWRQGGFQGSR